MSDNQGGLFDFGGGDAQGAGFTVQESRFTTFDFKGKADAQTCWLIKLFSPKSGKVFEKYLPAGRECQPKEDGTGVVGQIWKNSAAAKALTALTTPSDQAGPFVQADKKTPINGAGVAREKFAESGVRYLEGGTLFCGFDGFDSGYLQKPAQLTIYGFIPDASKADAEAEPFVDEEARRLLEELPGDVTKAQVPGLLMRALRETEYKANEKTRIVTRAIALFGAEKEE